MRDVRPYLFAMLLVLVLASGISLTLQAQPPGYTVVKNLSAFQERFQKESAKVETIESSFKQNKILLALTEEISATGRFWFKRTDRVKIEYKKPFTYTMVLNGDKMLVRDGQKEGQINVRSNKLFQQVNRIMIDCVQGTILQSKDFDSRVFENEKMFLLELTPKAKALREFFQTIILTVDKKDYSANAIEMNEPSGDKTTISFLNKKINGAIDDAVFAL
ncbi:MAG: outer membrane lipoprotein carrier protein LolA [Chryseolinea sp.]